MNSQIRVPQVRLIDVDGTQVGIKSIQEALNLALSRGTDLVEISPTSAPPVCKVMDYSKFRYEQDKKDREARKKQKTTHLKEVRFRPRIGEHDLLIKIEHAREFLKNMDKVQVTAVFMGREMQHRELGSALLERFKNELIDIGELENRPTLLGNRMSMLFNPRKLKPAPKPSKPAPVQKVSAEPVQPAGVQPAPASETKPPLA